MARHRIAVALLVAQPLATELDGIRRALGAAERERVAPHATLVSPINLRDEPLLAALDLVRTAAEASGPLRLTLGPATTFAPVTPTVHLAVGGEDLDGLLALRASIVAKAPLLRDEPHEFVPHVTLTQVLAPPERIRQVFRVSVPGAVECLTDRDAQTFRGEPGREPVDRHDPTGVEHLAVALHDLELGVVQGPATPEPLQPPGYDDLLALSQPPLDEPPPEPGGLDLTSVVAEARDGPLDAPSPCRLDVDVLDADTGRYDCPLLHPDEVAELRHLAQIVIPPRQVEEQVTDVIPAQSDPGAPQEACSGEPGLREGGR